MRVTSDDNGKVVTSAPAAMIVDGFNDCREVFGGDGNSSSQVKVSRRAVGEC